MKEQKRILPKKLLLMVAFMLVAPALIMANKNTSHAFYISGYDLEGLETVTQNDIIYTLLTADFLEKNFKDSLDESKYNAILTQIHANNGVYMVVDYSNEPTILNVENTINNKPVMLVCDNSDVTSLTIPANVVEFFPDDWRNLDSLTISADNNYYALENGVLYNKAKTEIICYISNQLGTTLTFPNTIKKISSFPSKDVKVVNVPASVTSLPQSYATYTNILTAINVDKNNKKYSSKDGVLYNKKKTKLIYYPLEKKGKTYKMPSTVKTLPECIMSDQKYVEKIVLSNKIKEIPQYSFANMKKLKSVTFPNKLQKIGGYCFENCPKLKKVTIPSTCKRIDRAFDYCDNLKTVTLKSKKITINMDFADSKKYTLVLKKGATVKCEFNSSTITCKQSNILSVTKHNDSLYTFKAKNIGKATLTWDNAKLKVKVVK